MPDAADYVTEAPSATPAATPATRPTARPVETLDDLRERAEDLVNGGASVRVILRRIENGAISEVSGSAGTDSLSGDVIREKWGPGQYRAELKTRGNVPAGQVTFSVAAPLGGLSKPAAAPVAPAPAAPALAGGGLDVGQLFMLQMQLQGQMMQTLLTSALQRPAAPASDKVIDAFRAGMDIAREAGGGGNEWAGIARAAMERLAPAAAALPALPAKAAPAQAGAAAPPAPAAPAQPAPPAPALDLQSALGAIASQCATVEGRKQLAAGLCAVAESKPGYDLLRVMGGVMNHALRHGASVHAPPADAPAAAAHPASPPTPAPPAAAGGGDLRQALSKNADAAPAAPAAGPGLPAKAAPGKPFSRTNQPARNRAPAKNTTDTPAAGAGAPVNTQPASEEAGAHREH